MYVKDERSLRELMHFYLQLERRMKDSGRLLIALHARKQYTIFRRQLTGTWGSEQHARRTA